MTRKKYAVSALKSKDVCIANRGFSRRDEWMWAIYRSQLEWPEYVNDTYCYESQSLEDNEEDINRILSFLEDGANHGALVYRRYHVGFSWVVLDEYAYAQLCNSLAIAKDFILVEQNPKLFKLVRRGTSDLKAIGRQANSDEESANRRMPLEKL